MNNVATLSRQLTERERTARQALNGCLTRLADTDPRVNAFTDRCLERAFAEADMVDRRRERGEVLGPLAGIPYAVKNLFDVQGMVTRAGSKINRNHPPAKADAVLVQRMQTLRGHCGTLPAGFRAAPRDRGGLCRSSQRVGQAFVRARRTELQRAQDKLHGFAFRGTDRNYGSGCRQARR